MKNTLNRAVSLALALSTFVLVSTSSAAAASIHFKDVKSTAWYNTYVSKLVELKITSGYKDGTYKPISPVTRAEFVTFLCKAVGHQPAQGDSFNDTRKHWSAGYITIALNNGIIDVTDDKKFRPDISITRLEAVEMLCRALNITKDTAAKNPYRDVKTAECGYANAAYANYLMQGSQEKNGRYFKPSSKLTRAEAAAIVVNACDYHADKIAYLNKRIAAENEKAAKEKAEQERYTAWKESVKDIAPELLNNTNGLYKDSVYESNKYLKTETDYLKNWGTKYGMIETEFENEIVRVGNDIMNLWYNADYKKLKELENGFKKLGETNFINNSMKRNLDYVKNNKFVSEGNFITSTGLLVYTEDGSMTLRGTIKYKYLSPTSTNVLNSEIVGSTGKTIQLGVWYEQDYQIRFYPETDGLRFTRMDGISNIRISK